jgi:hypothetical protein
VEVPLHSTGDASRRSALLVGRIFPIFWIGGRLARLGATRHFHHGLIGRLPGRAAVEQTDDAVAERVLVVGRELAVLDRRDPVAAGDHVLRRPEA